MAKPFWTSKTFWLGVITIAIGILNYVQGYISNGTAITLEGVLIIVLRVLTNQPISLGRKKP